MPSTTKHLSPKKALALCKMFTEAQISEIRGKVGPGVTKLDFTVRVQGMLSVAPDGAPTGGPKACLYTLLWLSLNLSSVETLDELLHEYVLEMKTRRYLTPEKLEAFKEQLGAMHSKLFPGAGPARRGNAQFVGELLGVDQETLESIEELRQPVDLMAAKRRKRV